MADPATSDNPYATPNAPLRRSIAGLGWAFVAGAAVGLAVACWVVVEACRDTAHGYNPLTGAGLNGIETGWTWHNFSTGVFYGVFLGVVVGSLATGITVCGWLILKGISGVVGRRR
jgi:hypothetical protein